MREAERRNKLLLEYAKAVEDKRQEIRKKILKKLMLIISKNLKKTLMLD